MKKKKCFLAAPFKSLVDKTTSKMEEREIKKILDLIEYLENKNFEVHNAHKRENWGQDFMTPDECTRIDFQQIRECDLFVAFPGNPASPGTHIEIGWASAFSKQIILLLENSEKDYAYLIRGLGVICDVKQIVYSDEREYFYELDKYFNG